MRSIILAGTAALLLASSAQAVTFAIIPGAPDSGPLPGQSIVVDFDNPNAPGHIFSGDFGIALGSSPAAAAPSGVPGLYGYVSSALGSGIAELNTPDLRSISFYWGSIDNFNFLEVLGAGGGVLASFDGDDFSPADGDQSDPFTNERLHFVADAGEVITGLRFRSTGVAFEFDDFAAQAVPEPATWALMLSGFGMVGYAMRQRRKMVTVSA